MFANDHLDGPDKWFVYNDPAHWGDIGIWKPPLDVDVQKYQKRIDDIVGLSSTGAPVVRLKWAWDVREWTNCEWDSFGVATKGEWRARYRFLTVKVGEDYTDISVPRWVLEERYEPGQYESSWDASRYATDSETGVRKDVMGPAPRDGWYKMIWGVGMICTHNAKRTCCERVNALKRKHCWGFYKTPGERELQMLARAVKERNASTDYSNPHAPFPEELVAKLQAAELDRAEVTASIKLNDLERRMASLQTPSMIRGQQIFDVGVSFQRKETSGLYVPTN